MSAGRRVARGSIAAGLATWVALAFHLLGGGGMPTPAGIITPFVLSWCACVALAGWREHALRLTVSVLVSQALFHLLFTLGAPAAAHGGHHGSAVHLGQAEAVGAAPWSHMWLAHLVAAAITVLALRSGEQALGRLSRAILAGARRLCAPPVLDPLFRVVAPPSMPTRPDVRPGLGWFHREISRRGPPVSAPSR